MGEMREIGNINERVVFSFSLTCRKYIFSQKLGSSSDLKPITAKVALTKFYSVFKGARWTRERRERRDQKKQPHQVRTLGLHHPVVANKTKSSFPSQKKNYTYRDGNRTQFFTSYSQKLGSVL